MAKKQSELYKLKRWMEEVVLDHRMGRDGELEMGDSSAPDFSQEPAPSENQIRLWPAVQGGDQPLYGVVHSSEYGFWRVLPFSPYAFPALPEELRIREEPPVRVLQGWNSRLVPQQRCAASWRVAELSAEQIFVFERWWLMVQSGEVSGASFGSETGPEIRHPQDPRHDYLASERTRVDMILGEEQAHYGEDSLRKAAEPAEESTYGEEDERS